MLQESADVCSAKTAEIPVKWRAFFTNNRQGSWLCETGLKADKDEADGNEAKRNEQKAGSP